MQQNIPTGHVDINHHLQRQVLVLLRQNGPAAYQQLKPDGIEGNAFNYHLRNLRKANLITHKDDLYELTPTGYLVADAFSMEKQRLMLRPHLYTILLITSAEYVLLYEHARPPLKGKLALLSGKMHYGDTFTTSIAREAKRRQLSGDYEAVALAPFNIRYLKDGEVALQRAGTLWHISYNGPLEECRTVNGRSRWVERSELVDMPECLPEVWEGLKRLDENSSVPIDTSYDM